MHRRERGCSGGAGDGQPDRIQFDAGIIYSLEAVDERAPHQRQSLMILGRAIIGNKAASGTAIIDELGPEHMKTGAWIVYTSADSVMQLAAHNEVIPLDELYQGCEIARRLCDPLKIGRVIARPFAGSPGAFERTEDRRDYAYTPDEPLITERLFDAGVPVYAVGKIEDIVAHRGITKSIHSGNNRESQQAVEQFLQKEGDAFIFANFIDFDMLCGHRRDPEAYAAALRQTDEWLGHFIHSLKDDDVLILNLIEAMFFGAGAEVYTAKSGAEALDLLAAHSPDLVLLDIMMPDMNGFETCGRIQQRSRVPIIFLTAYGEQESC